MANGVKNDVLFQLLFGQQKYDSLLISLLNAILSLPEGNRITGVVINTSFRLEKCLPNDKVGIIDIRAVTSSNFFVNIEMQLLNEYNIDKRTLFYWAKLYSGQIKTGEKYEQLNKAITINILDFNKKDSSNYHSVYHLCEDTNQKLLIDDIEIHFIQLPKFRKLSRNYKSTLNNWLLFIDGAGKEELEMAKKEDPIIKEAEEVREYLLSDEEVQRLCELREKYILDERSNREGARKEGIEEGVKKGMKKGMKQGMKAEKIKIAQKMLCNGYDIKDIIELTGIREEDLQ